MTESAFPPDLKEAVRFHGHFCLGLAIGYRAAKIGMQRLEAGRSEDEELIAIVDNDSCAADGVQWITGCTFGKGNVFFRDYGKQVFTFALRGSGRAVRVAVKPADQLPAVPEGDRKAKADQILNAPAEVLFNIEDVTITLPEPVVIRESIMCDRCGEGAIATRTRRMGDQTLCIPCAEAEQKGADR